MSCCGCASRVLKLQSEIRSWKTKLADEKREKKMILRWITAVFGYDVRVDIDKETRGIRLQASENKEAVAKALIKLGLGGGNEGDVGMMVMEIKLEDHEFYEPFEEPHDIPEFPILEINSMSTQAPVVNTGISTLGHISQHSAPTLSITTPMEVASTPLPINNVVDQEVVYIAGNFEEGATLEGINGQSYIIVRANDNEDMPMQLDYAATEDIIGEGNNLYFRSAIPSLNETQNAINYLSTTPKSTQVQLSLPTVVTPIPDSLVGRGIGIVPQNISGEIQSAVFPSPPPVKLPSKKKSSLSSSKVISQVSGNTSSKKQKSGETNLKIKSVVRKSQSGVSTSKQTKSASAIKPSSFSHQQLNQMQDSKPANLELPETTPITPSSPKKEAFEFGLTLREKAEMYVLQKANDSVERVSNGFRCTVCLENRYTYSNFETAMAHAKSHYESKPYKCEYCDELFAIQKELLTHRKIVHPKPKGASSSLFSSRLTQGTKQLPTTNVTPRMINAGKTPTLNHAFATGSGKIYSSISNINNANVIGSHFSHPQQAKTIVVQAPFDNNLVKSPIRVSNEVLEALLRGSNVSIFNEDAATSSATYVTDNNEFFPSSLPISKIPAIVLTTQGSVLSKSQNINFSLNNFGGIASHTVNSHQAKRKQ